MRGDFFFYATLFNYDAESWFVFHWLLALSVQTKISTQTSYRIGQKDTDYWSFELAKKFNVI